MRYQIAKYECPEFVEILQLVASNSGKLVRLKKLDLRSNERIRYSPETDEHSFVYFCKSCGAELYGIFQGFDKEYTLEWHLKDIKRAKDWYKEWSNDKRYDSDEYQRTLNVCDTAIDVAEEAYALVEKVQKECLIEYEKAVNIKKCPICGETLSQEKGFFLPDRYYFVFKNNNLSRESIDKAESEYEKLGGSWGMTYTEKFEAIALFRETIDRMHTKSEASTFVKSCDLPVTESAQSKVSEIKENSDQLKKYILHLIHLENNIYALERQLSELYYQSVHNNRSVVLSVHEPAYVIKAELEDLRAAFQKAEEGIRKAEVYQPNVYVEYPSEPTAPVLGKPGLFNKKKVLEENEAMTVKYKSEMEAYRKEVKRCDEEKERLVAEERAKAISEAKLQSDAAKTALNEAERSMDDKMKALEVRPAPAKAVKKVLDKEIAEAEELLKKTFAARNELYAYDIIFRKYRNAVALSSFYEYLMSGRCTSLEGSDGAYNIYESEIRANRVIAQLDTVISSLENIKQNQYMMYEELCSINSSLDSLNSTMDKALTSIQGIEANTRSMNEYMEHISKNSDVIAHNTAVTAYYSKVNAELTNALGYMVAFG